MWGTGNEVCYKRLEVCQAPIFLTTVTPILWVLAKILFPCYYIINSKGEDFNMLQDHLEKEPSKSDLQRKNEAWKTLNSVLVKANAEFSNSLQRMLHEKQVQNAELQKKIEEGNGTEEENALVLFIGGYIQCLQDILKTKSQN